MGTRGPHRVRGAMRSSSSTSGNRSGAWNGIRPPALTAALFTAAKVKAAPGPSEEEEWGHRTPRRLAYTAQSREYWMEDVHRAGGWAGSGEDQAKDGGVVPSSTITPTPFRGTRCLFASSLRRVATRPVALAASSPVGRVHAFLWIR